MSIRSASSLWPSISADVTSPRKSYAQMVREVAQYVAPFAAEHGSDLRDMHMLAPPAP